jgi:molybdopterin adenylyltransferase
VADQPKPRGETEQRLIRVAVITVSDRAYQGIYKDESGPKVVAAFPKDLYEVVIAKIVPDEVRAISSELARCADVERVDVVVTTGGAGCSIRDVTPEATAAVIQREIIGFSEVIRLANRDKNPNAILSRGLSGIRNQTVIINLPGNPENAKMAIESVLSAIPHCIKTIRQQRPMKRTAAPASNATPLGGGHAAQPQRSQQSSAPKSKPARKQS